MFILYPLSFFVGTLYILNFDEQIVDITFRVKKMKVPKKKIDKQKFAKMMNRLTK